MAAEVAPDATAKESTPDSAAELRHLHPVPDDGPVPDETTAQSLDEVASAEPDASATAPDGAEAAPSRFRVDLSALLAWGRVTFTPQSGMWTQRPLAPDEVMDRARRGSHLADAGPLRTAAIADSYAAATTKAVLRSADWLLDHPARRVVATVLLTALLLYPPTRTVLGWALAPAAWAHGLLT
ncbi:hypothetical protein GCM10027174_44890 [Salinifilum aidingensis]